MSKTNTSAADFRLLDTFWREPVERTVLPNGLTVLLKPDHSAPVASVQVWVKTGSIHEGALLGAGLSHYLEHLLFKGTAKRAGREISTTVQAHGGYINAYTTFDRTVYYIDLPAEHVAVAVDLLADMVLHSSLPADEVAREKDVILREIDMGRDDPDQRLGETLFDTAFRQHPFRYPIIGYKEIFSSVSRDDLVAYYQARYVPNNLVVVVAGAIDSASTMAAITKHFGATPRQRLAPVLLTEEPPQLASRALHRFEEVELTRSGLAWHIPGIAHADAPLLDLVSVMLGGGDSSVLWQEVREKAGLVHAIDTHSWTPAGMGLFYISYTCDAGKREAATAAIEKLLARYAVRGFTPAQLKKAIRQLVVGEINSRKTMSGQASRLGSAEVVVGDVGFTKTYFERLRAATNADFKRVLKTYLVPARQTAVSLNPLATAGQTTTAKKAKPAAVEFDEIKLPNGVRLLLQHEPHLPNIHLRLLCLGGAHYEKPGKRGASSLLATMLTKDTRKRSAAEVAHFIEEVGGSFFPFSGNNSLGLAAEVLPTDLDRALALLEEAVFSPTFKASTFKTECEAQIADLKQDADDVVTLGRKLARKKFFGTYPLGVEPGGEIEGLRALTPTDLAALWKTLFVSDNIVLAVAGDFDRRTLVPKLKKMLGRVPRGKLALPSIKFEKPAEVGDFVEVQPREQAVVFQAFPGPGLCSPDFYVGEVADELFSGMSSRLFERVREEKGLAYFVRSSRVSGLDTGMFSFYAGTSPKSYAEVLVEFDAEIARVQAGQITADELSRCQTRLKAARRMSLQTNSSRAMQAGLNVLCGLPINDWQNYGGYIDAVTIEAITGFAQKYFKRELRTQLVVRP
ncbi:MAG: insulinase family protein [Verrucomicrobia bacterium]|nr:insulinase family protein [Verrucomicrobiota bacterium]